MDKETVVAALIKGGRLHPEQIRVIEALMAGEDVSVNIRRNCCCAPPHTAAVLARH